MNFPSSRDQSSWVRAPTTRLKLVCGSAGHLTDTEASSTKAATAAIRLSQVRRELTDLEPALVAGSPREAAVARGGDAGSETSAAAAATGWAAAVLSRGKRESCRGRAAASLSRS